MYVIKSNLGVWFGFPINSRTEMSLDNTDFCYLVELVSVCQCVDDSS